MSSSPELLQFFLAESAEYLDGLEQLVTGIAPPDAGTFVATARALRGSATMARANRIADVAFALEQIANRTRDGELSWTEELRGRLAATVEELRGLAHSVRTWSTPDDERAVRTLAGLQVFLPNVARPTPVTTGGGTTPMFIALQAAAIASDLDAFVHDSTSRRTLDDVLTRVRIMRGIAGIGDFAPLADVCDAVERCSRALAPDAPLAREESDLFRAAAAVLRRASEEMRSRGRPDPTSMETQRFARALSTIDRAPAEPAHVVHIDELFHADAGPHLVHRGDALPATRDARFRDEVISRAEHLRRLVNDARHANDPVARDRVQREVTGTLQSLERTASSFGAAQIASFCADAVGDVAQFSPTALDALDAAALLLSSPASSIQDIERRMAVVTRRRNTPVSTTAVTNGPRRSPVTPTGRELQDLLANGIARLSPLEQEAFSPVTTVVDAAEDLPPIDALLYRGAAALRRATEVRDLMRARGAPDEESLNELYDLIDLARVD